MSRLNNILLALATALMPAISIGCSEEKELISLDTAELPCKVRNLYLLGDVTPSNTNMDVNKPEPLIQNPENPFLWSYHGVMNPGIFKVCFKAGTWAQNFIHPWTNRYEQIGRDPIVDCSMQTPRMGGEDELWQVTVAGIYFIEFNLKDWTYTCIYEREPDPEPIEHMYLLGSVTTSNPDFDINKPEVMTRSQDNPDVWVFHGQMIPGIFKVATKRGTWASPMFHPLNPEGERFADIGTATLTDRPMQPARSGGEDELWRILEAGEYTLTFDIVKLTWSSQYHGKGTTTEPDEPDEPDDPTDPTEIKNVYLLGDVTEGNPLMDIDLPEPLTKSDNDPDEWIWHGHLNKGKFKLCTAKGTWSQLMIHPFVSNGGRFQDIGADPLTDMILSAPRAGGNDELWRVTVPGTYTLRFNLRTLSWSSVCEPD